MSDGTIRPARFTGLNLGFVTLDDADQPRNAVAAIMLAGSAAKADVLIGRDGQRTEGTIAKCSAASCTIDGKVVAHDAIRWLGLEQEGSAPPAAPTGDEIFLSGKPAVAARVSAVDDQSVRTTHGTFRRSDVQWIYVADTPPSQTKPEYQVDDDAPEEETPATPEGGKQPPSQPKPKPKTTPPTAAKPAAQAGGNCKPGPVWTGTIRSHATGHDERSRTDQKQTIDVRLQERICIGYNLTTYERAGTVSVFNATGSVIKEEWLHIDRNYTCKGSGTMTVDDPAYGSGTVYRNESSAAAPYGFELPKGRALYVVSTPARPPRNFTVDCQPSAGGSELGISGSPILGRSPLKQAPYYEDTQLRFLEGGKMIGSGTAPANALLQKIDFTWSICPENVSCPPAPALPDDTGPEQPSRPDNKDPCGDLQRYIDEGKQLADAYKKFESEYKDAVRKRDVVRDQIYGVTGALRQFFSAFASVLSDTGGASEPYSKLVKLVNALAGMSGQGNGSDIYSAIEALGYGPGDVAQKAAETAAVRAAAQAANDYLTKTNDHQGALRIYAATLGRSEEVLAQAKQGADVLSFIQDAAEFAEKTSSFADLLQEYNDYNETATRDQKGMDDINDRQRDLQAKIDEARGQCQNGTALPKWMRHDAGCRECAYELAQTKAPASLRERAAAVAAQLKSVKPEMEAAVPYLLPFADQVTDGIDPRLLIDLANEAAKHLRKIQTTLKDAATQWKSIESQLPKDVPKATGAPRT